MRQHRRYDDKFRASSVVMLEASGYPATKGALERTARHLNVPTNTLKGWYLSKNNPPPTELRNEKRGEIKELIRNELYGILDEMGRKRSDAEYRELATALGIAVDKLQILSGQPTENINQRVVIEYADS